MVNDADFQTSRIFSLVFKRNSGVFVSCPSPVPSPSPQLNYFFPFLKEAFRWKGGLRALRSCVVAGLVFKGAVVCLVGGFYSMLILFLGGGGLSLRSCGCGGQSSESTG